MSPAKKTDRSARQPAGEGFEPAAVHTIADLETIRTLSDPLRLRILETFIEAECTTKQAAETLGEKPTRLYHHVEAMEKAGLIRLTRTRQNRGTLEKYYRAVAKVFRADEGLFRGKADPETMLENAQGMLEVVRGLTATANREIEALVARGEASGLAERALISFVEIRGDEAELKKIERRINRLVRDLAKLAENPGTDGEQSARLLLAFYPLER